jgi:hypothetical protein
MRVMPTPASARHAAENTEVRGEGTERKGSERRAWVLTSSRNIDRVTHHVLM